MMDLDVVFSALADVKKDEKISKHTTFRIGGEAKYFLYPKNTLFLSRIIEVCKEVDLPYKVLGKGSNVLWMDEYFDGVVICLDRYFNEVAFAKEEVFAQAGISLILLAHEALQHSLSGLEFASGIPATLGGALFMNAGAYKSSMSDIVIAVQVLKEGEIVWLQLDEMEYGYRHSILHAHRDWIVLGARLRLQKGEQVEIKELMDARRVRRMDSQPLHLPNAGSVFANDVAHAAWSLIEQSGMRGVQIGGAQISEKHANFIVNVDDANAKDVLSLVKQVRHKVEEEFDVQLKMEIEYFTGEYDD